MSLACSFDAVDVSTVTLSSFSVSDTDTCLSGLGLSFTLLLGSKLDPCAAGSGPSLSRPDWSLWRGCSDVSGDDLELLTITRIRFRLGAGFDVPSLHDCLGVFTLTTRRFCADLGFFLAGDLVIFSSAIPSSVDTPTAPVDSRGYVSRLLLFHI